MCNECITTVKIILFGFMLLYFDTTKLTRIYANSCEQNQGFENHRNTEPILAYSTKSKHWSKNGKINSNNDHYVCEKKKIRKKESTDN